MKINSWKLKRWTVCVIVLVSFGAGSLITARLAHINQVRADSNRIFEMHVYHTVPGKVPALESQFRDRQSKLLAKHDLKDCGLLGARGDARLGQHLHFHRGSFQPGGSKKELGCYASRPRFSRVDQRELRTGQQTRGKSRRVVHAADGFLADE